MAVTDVLGWGWLAFLSGCLLGFVVRSVALDSPFAAKVDQRVCSKYAYGLPMTTEEAVARVVRGTHGNVKED